MEENSFIIFLDCDGVINQIKPDMKMFSIDEECVRRLGKVTAAYEAKVILCSTWRAGYDVKGGRHADYIENLIKVFKDYGISLAGITPDSGHEEKRAEEIAYYCRRNNISKYLILDDDESLYSSKDRLFIINSKTGITDKDVKTIIKMKKSLV